MCNLPVQVPQRLVDCITHQHIISYIAPIWRDLGKPALGSEGHVTWKINAFLQMYFTGTKVLFGGYEPKYHKLPYGF